MLRILARRLTRRDLIAGSLAAGAAVVAAPTAGRTTNMTAPARQATPAAAGDPAATFAEFADVVSTRMQELNVPGVALGVIAGDQEHTAVFGVTNVQQPVPVERDTIFQIGSTTKTVTATAIMRLVEQGTLDLDAPVRTYLPDFRVADPDVSREVRLRHLLTHTAGWNDDALSQETGDGDGALASYVTTMAARPQVTPLGEFFSYNNGAVCLAGHVIEAVTGQTYEAAVTELVLEPLGMERALFFPEEIMTKPFAVGHGLPPGDPQGVPVVLEPWALPRLANPAGGLSASLNDELRYARFHLGDGTVDGTRVLSAEGLRQMQTPLGPGGSTPLGVLDNVGVTWRLQDRGGATIVSHAGGTFGQQSNLALVPELGFAVTILTNADTGAVLQVEATDWALERFVGLATPPLTPVSLPPERLGEYTGEYLLPEDAGTVEVNAEDGALHLTMRSTGQTEPTIESPVRMLGDDLATVDYMGVPVFTDFVRDDASTVDWIRIMGRMTPRAA